MSPGLGRRVSHTHLCFQALVQEISGRSPLVQAVQEAGHSLVSHTLSFSFAYKDELKDVLHNLDLHRSEVTTLRLMRSRSAWRS